MTAAPIGVLGGTFDPVHSGHLRVAIEACEVLGLEHVRLVPLHLPNHRVPPVASAAMRCDMLRTVAAPPIVLDEREIERGGVSYTVDTLADMRRQWPTRSLCLIMGADAYRALPTWHRAGELLRLAHIVVAARPAVGILAHADLDELTANAQSECVDDLHRSSAGRVFFLDIPLLPIAASDLRARCRAGRDIRHLVPEPVYDMIKRHHLYQS